MIVRSGCKVGTSSWVLKHIVALSSEFWHIEKGWFVRYANDIHPRWYVLNGIVDRHQLLVEHPKVVRDEDRVVMQEIRVQTDI